MRAFDPSATPDDLPGAPPPPSLPGDGGRSRGSAHTPALPDDRVIGRVPLDRDGASVDDTPPIGWPADVVYPPTGRAWDRAARYGHRPSPIPSDHTGEVDALRRIARSLASGLDAGTVLRVLCDAAMEQGRASGAMVAEVSGEGGHFLAARGVVADLAGGAFPLAGSVTARVWAERRTIAVETMLESSPFFEALLGSRGVGPALVVPLIAHDAILGVLIVTRRTDTPPFDADDERRLSTIADLAALGLWKARLLEEARAADAAKTGFLATLSHELRTPMAALEGYGELLEDEILGPLVPAQRDVLVHLRAVSRHLGSLIEEILTYASLEADRVVPRLAPVRVEELLDSLYPFLAPLAREKGLVLRLHADPDLPVVATDEDRVRQVLLNLGTNALKFTDAGEVSIEVQRGPQGPDDEPTVHCSVRDTGVGIAREDLARLFRPFTQVDDGPTRRHGGTGLGLYISRRLSELLGGRIIVESTPGVGSTFTLVLPVGA